MNLDYFRNYSSQYIKNLIDIRYTNLSENEKHSKLVNQFKQIINNIRHYTNTTEIDRFNSPMGFLFQHLKPDIIQIVANCAPKYDKLFIERGLINNNEWNTRLFATLRGLNAKDIIIWFFLQVPYYNVSIRNIDAFRNQYDKIMDMLIASTTEHEPFQITEEEYIFICNETCMPYALAYHDRNNSTIMKKYCQCMRKLCPWLNYYSGRVAEKLFNTTNLLVSQQTPQQLKQQQTPPKKRICFISDSFHTDSSVLRDRVAIISKLDKTRFDVYFASFIPLNMATVQGCVSKIFFKNITTPPLNNFIYLGNTIPTSTTQSPSIPATVSLLSNARMILEKYEFDIIIYPDLGMKLLPTLLAYSRLAKTQITTWGHSDTSGIDTIDYYISSEWFENDKSREYYSEKLVLFKSLGTYYISPHKLFIETQIQNDIQPFKTREELGFANNTITRIYCCLQTFYKINEEFERCLARILELDPGGIILLSNSYPYCQSHLLRMQSILGDEKIKKLLWYPSLDKKTFLNLITISDVVLDPFPFGGCNTSFEAFDYNIPVITYPGKYLHGRFTAGLYAKMQLADCECIVTNGEDYAIVATKIGLNEKLKHKISRNIEMQKHHIFQERESIDEWNTFLSADAL